MTDSAITGIVCPPLKLLKPFSSPKPPTKNSASSAYLISSPSISRSVPQQTTARSNAKSGQQVHLPSLTKTDKNSTKEKVSIIKQTKRLKKLHPKPTVILLHNKRFKKPPERKTVSESDSASVSTDSSPDCLEYDVKDMILD
ncbi:hypothetical protein CDAR_300261 [Caerostris darwini]|uniref:Uncharacterized protein n=1 Tax=Caerostris darwini TaxID=1538125 RepID=A0AAV4V917_9ARAC|nr:hypothetical protein CDAR_300261 [Caerostris darwini]